LRILHEISPKRKPPVKKKLQNKNRSFFSESVYLFFGSQNDKQTDQGEFTNISKFFISVNYALQSLIYPNKSLFSSQIYPAISLKLPDYSLELQLTTSCHVLLKNINVELNAVQRTTFVVQAKSL